MIPANTHYKIEIKGDLLIFTPPDKPECVVHIPKISTWDIDKAHPDFHHYEMTYIAAGIDDVPDISVIWQNLKEEPYPTLGLKSEDTAKVDGQISHVPLAGDVSHYFGDHVVVNVTQPGHILHPSLVARYVFEEDGHYKIASVGIGNRGKEFLLKYILPRVWQMNVLKIGEESKEEACFYPRKF